MKLFDKLKFEDFATAVIRNSIKEVKSVKTSNNDIEEKAKSIVQDFEFTVPVLLKDQTDSEIKLEREEDGSQKAIAIFTVPFDGNHEILNLKPAKDCVDLPGSFELDKGKIHFKIKIDSDNIYISEEWQKYIINESINTMAKIETNLAILKNEYEQFKTELYPLTVNLLLARERELQGKEFIEKNINTFNP